MGQQTFVLKDLQQVKAHFQSTNLQDLLKTVKQIPFMVVFKHFLINLQMEGEKVQQLYRTHQVWHCEGCMIIHQPT